MTARYARRYGLMILSLFQIPKMFDTNYDMNLSMLNQWMIPICLTLFAKALKRTSNSAR